MVYTAVSAPLFFDKKMLKMCLIALIITPFCIGQPIVCVLRNISCVEGREGFKIRYECPAGSEFSIEANNGTVIASSESLSHSTEVSHMDNDWITIPHCQDVRMTCTTGQNHIKETCFVYNVTKFHPRNISRVEGPEGKPEIQDPLDPPKPWVYICVVIILITIGLGLFCWGYMSWKKEVRRHQGAATPSFLQYLLTCSCLRPCTFLAERDDREIRNAEGTELQEVMHGDRETQQNGDVRIVIPHDRDPRGSGEAGEENTLENGHVHSNDISAPKVNGESHHRALSRNPRDDDPGGANSNERKDGIRKIASGWAVGDHTAEDHETERLLTKKRAANPDFDVTGEATDLVNKPGFDQDQVSSCSVAPETDVESTHDMKNE